MDKANKKLLIEVVKETGVAEYITDYIEQLERWETASKIIRMVNGKNHFEQRFNDLKNKGRSYQEELLFNVHEFCMFYFENDYDKNIKIDLIFAGRKNYSAYFIFKLKDIKNIKQLEHVNIIGISRGWAEELTLDCRTDAVPQDVWDSFMDNESLEMGDSCHNEGCIN